jgi:hypothetical protein
MSKFTWTIIKSKEKTQSRTYGPLIALGIDGATVTFPEGWEENVFNHCLKQPGGKWCNSVFTNLHEFSMYVKGSIIKNFGNSSLATFLTKCDNKASLHLPSEIQEAILYDCAYVEGFLECIIKETKSQYFGNNIIAIITEAGAAAAAGAAGAANFHSPEGGTTQPDRTENSRIQELRKIGYDEENINLAKRIINDNPSVTVEFLIEMMVGGKRSKHSKRSKSRNKTLKRRLKK